MTQIKTTPIGKSYWNNEGAYQEEYTKLYEEMVPNSGSAQTLTGELIRAASKLGYEWCNNGNFNACEITTYCDEWDDEYEDAEIREDYQQRINLIGDTLEAAGDEEINSILTQIGNIILQGYDARNTPENDNAYDRMIDHVMAYALEHLGENDSEIPAWYDKD